MPKSILRSWRVVMAPLFLGALVGAPQVSRADIVYVSGSNNELGTLDLSTGTFSLIGTMSTSNNESVFGLGTAGPGTLSAVDGVGEAYSVSIANAATIDLGNTGGIPVGAAGSNSTLYALDSVTGALSSIAFPALTSTPIASTTIAGDGLVVVGPDGYVYVAGTINGSYDDLFKINVATGAYTDLGSTGFINLYAGVYADGKIYGFDSFGDIVTLNAATGAGTQVGTYSLPGGDYIYAAAAAVPEPCSLSLISIAIAGAVATFRRGRALRA